MKINNVFVGIQARSNSTRLPEKIFKDIGGKMLVDHVISACKKSALYMNRHSHKTGINVTPYLLIPENDEKLKKFYAQGIEKIQGPEHDVLKRYYNLFKSGPCDYIVRITSDCPLIPPYLISKSIMVATKGEYDFVTNASPDCRTYFDGSDVEVISTRLFKYIYENATSDSHKEHVTQYIFESDLPPWTKLAHVYSDIDLSEIKLSVDTEEDLENVRRVYNQVDQKRKKWSAKYGIQSCHRF